MGIGTESQQKELCDFIRKDVAHVLDNPMSVVGHGGGRLDGALLAVLPDLVAKNGKGLKITYIISKVDPVEGDGP